MAWFCSHKWYPAAVYHYLDTSYVDRGVPSTRITNRCSKCGKFHVEAHYGVGHIQLPTLQNAALLTKK